MMAEQRNTNELNGNGRKTRLKKEINGQLRDWVENFMPEIKQS